MVEIKLEMDVIEQQQKLRGKQHLNKALLLVSILTILLSLYTYYYATITYLLYGVHQFMSTRAMFLFCNAILLFLAKDSGLLDSSKLHDEDITLRTDNHLGADVADNKITDVVVDKSAVVPESVESKLLDLVVVREEQVSVHGDELVLAVVDELQVLGVDELNKRCEEFIERVKREISMSTLI